MKPTTKVFSSPQKMDPGMSKTQSKWMKNAMACTKKGGGGGSSADAMKKLAHRGPRQRG